MESAKIGASRQVTNSILKNAVKWLVYASMVTNSHVDEKVLVKIYIITVPFDANKVIY